MMNPDFSVIIPTLNRPVELEGCLRSLAAQKYPQEQFEIIVVDDGGQCQLSQSIAKYGSPDRIRLLRQKCMGPGAARNAGAAVSRGRYLAFTDDDCIAESNWLSAMQTALQSDRQLLVGGRVLNALSDNPYSMASQIVADFVHSYYVTHQGIPRFFATNNIAVHSEMFRALGGFTPSFRTSEDRDFCDRWLTAGYRLAYAPQAVVRHAHHLNLISFWKQHMGYGRGAWRFYRAYAKRHIDRSSIETAFYRTLFQRLPELVLRQNSHRAHLFSLMGIWQIANLAGFIAEAASSRNANGKGSALP